MHLLDKIFQSQQLIAHKQFLPRPNVHPHWKPSAAIKSLLLWFIKPGQEWQRKLPLPPLRIHKGSTQLPMDHAKTFTDTAQLMNKTFQWHCLHPWWTNTYRCSFSVCSSDITERYLKNDKKNTLSISLGECPSSKANTWILLSCTDYSIFLFVTCHKYFKIILHQERLVHSNEVEIKIAVRV